MTAGIKPYYRRNILFLSIVEIFWGVGLSFSHARVVLPAYLGELGATNLFLGVLAAIWVVGSSVPQSLSAYFTEHLPAKKRAVIFFHFLPPVAWLGLFVYNYWLVTGEGSHYAARVFFVPVWLFYACSLGVLLPIYLGFLSRVTEEGKRGSAFGSIFSAQCIFGAWAICCIGFLLAGRVFPRNYAFLFLLTAIAICAGNLFFIPVREPRAEDPETRRRLGEYFRELLAVFIEKRLLRRYVFLRLLIALNMLIVFFYVKHAESEFEWLDAVHVRYFVVFLLIGQSLGNLLFGRLGDRLGFRGVAATGAAFMLCAACVSVTMKTLPAFYLVMAAAGFYLAADWISHLNIVIQLSDEGKHTRDLGLVGFMTSLPLAGVSLLMGYLIDSISFAAVAIGSSVLAVLGVVLLLAMKMPGGTAPAERLTREPN